MAASRICGTTIASATLLGKVGHGLAAYLAILNFKPGHRQQAETPKQFGIDREALVNRYVQIQDGEQLPDIDDLKPFKAIVVVEGRSAPGWQAWASEWLVRSGCLYMMAWGEDCQSWDDSVDHANLEIFDFGQVPDEDSVMTTWHESETLEDVFRYAKELARHPTVELENVLILYVGAGDKQAELEAGFLQA